MRCEFIQAQSQQIYQKISPLLKPTSDVYNYTKALIYLGTNKIEDDWSAAKLNFDQAINRILQGNTDKKNYLFCEKMLLKSFNKQTQIGKDLYSLLTNCLNFCKKENRIKRSKSGQTTSKVYDHNLINNQTKIGVLVKSFKEEYQKMIETRPSLKSKMAEERVNRHIEQIKEKIKRTNKTSYFISPKKEQQEKAQSLNK
ncbi:unnamed protein product (macronuclear) [Paramecium tetraurelia]|uniref:Uncharacterized protein n=1 Tax=Paramecium tetraurelia TaxID=5888 RepID=A0C6D8_PARTE|nr:uncharacterized protein GSPATT00035484001 [Paramecium tetraurelia]CAK66355.1 unnamed protein product [Paramecium tetraurelia]|eukprot:XP_001433752.1 hypothetical protein (macronuclear) [Paramecium tetraurelia strain d4-2]